ncbi:MAG: SMP-30/gluconolactonase/LRE family protein [Rhizobiaceae bacterium]
MAGMEIETAPAFTPLSTVTAELGESPVWSAADDAVWWVDIPGRRLHLTSLANSATRSWATPEQIGFVALCANGVVAGMETGLFAFDPANGEFERIWRLLDEGVRFNDATTDPAGRLWAGTMDIGNARAAGKLLCIEPDMTVRSILTGMRIPNGLAVDAARGRLYVSDSHSDLQTVWAVDLDIQSGAVGERHVFARFHDLAGRPDGAALDADGNYWIAGVGGGEIYVFTPDGRIAATIPTPMDGPTKPAFGDGRIFLTSKSGAGNGGRLMAAPSPIRGAPVPHFGPQPALVGGMTE